MKTPQPSSQHCLLEVVPGEIMIMMETLTLSLAVKPQTQIHQLRDCIKTTPLDD